MERKAKVTQDAVTDACDELMGKKTSLDLCYSYLANVPSAFMLETNNRFSHKLFL